MAGLVSKKIKDSYKSLIRVDDDTNGLDGSLANITDGAGNTGPFQMSRTAVEFTSGTSLTLGASTALNTRQVNAPSGTLGLSIDFSPSDTGLSKIILGNNLADALNIAESTNSYLKFVTTTGSEKIVLGKDVEIAGDLTAATITGDVNFDSNTLFIDESENRVGIGLNNPATTLDVSGNANITGALTVDNITINGSDVNNSTGNFTFSHSGTEKLRITSDKVMFSADAKVDANNTRDLGTTGTRWKDLYLAGDANVNGDGSFGTLTTGTLTASGDVNFDSNTLFVDASENRVGIGTNSPDTILDINSGSSAESSADAGAITVTGQNSGVYTALRLRHEDASGGGTDADEGIAIKFQGYDGSNFRNMAQISVIANDAVGSSDSDGSIVFSTTTSGGTALSEKMRITESGQLTLGGDGSDQTTKWHTGSAYVNAKLDVRQLVVAFSNTDVITSNTSGDLTITNSTNFGSSTGGALEIVSTNAGDVGAVLSLFHQSASTANNDFPAIIRMYGRDASNNKTEMGNIGLQMTDSSASSEDAQIKFGVISDGSLGSKLILRGTESEFYTNDVFIPERLTHSDDADTFIRFTDDKINFVSGNSTALELGGTVSNNTMRGDLTITETNGDANAGPILTLQRDNSASEDNNDILGEIQFQGSDSINTTTNVYAQINAQINDISHTGEDGRLHLQTQVAGTMTDTLVCNTGRVGIGTSSPTIDALLHIKKDQAAYTRFIVENTTTSTSAQALGSFISDAGTLFMGITSSTHAASGDAIINQTASGKGFKIITGGSDRMRIGSNGDVQFNMNSTGFTSIKGSASVALADDASISVNVGDNQFIMLSENTLGRGALFHCTFPQATPARLSDPNSIYAAADSDGDVCVFSSANSSTVTIKNRLGAQHNFRIIVFGV